MQKTPHILVVDDDHEIRRLLGRYLQEQGFKVSVAATRREFEERIVRERVDLVILDVMLPDGSGLELCRALRANRPNMQVILLTALKEDVDRIIGLEVGADDYLGKPFNPRELVARIRAVLRRVENSPEVYSELAATYIVANLRAELSTRRVHSTEGKEVDLTGAEFELLRAFLQRPGRILSREQLLDITQGRDATAYDRSVDVLLSRLRRKLSAVCAEPLFKTVRNGGYMLAAKVERSGGGQ